MELSFDKRSGVAYVKMADSKVAYSRELDPLRVLDYDEQHHVVGIEFLSTRDGVQVKDLPRHDELAEMLAKYEIRIAQ